LLLSFVVKVLNSDDWKGGAWQMQKAIKRYTIYRGYSLALIGGFIL
jgi:hypothetical protein